MSIFDSISRGFGFTVGKKIANTLLSGNQVGNQVTNSSQDLEDWSHNGFKEGDVDFVISRNFKKDEINWILFPFTFIISAIPFLGLLINSNFLYKVVLKKHYIYFFDFVWETYKVSDKRTKEGTREVKVLERRLSKTDRFPTPIKNVIQITLSFIVSLVSTLYVIYS